MRRPTQRTVPGRRVARPGFMVVELTAGVLLILVVMSLMVSIVGWDARERSERERRRWALIEAQNALERVVALPHASRTEAAIEALRLSDRIARTLPGGALEVEQSDLPGRPGVRRIRVVARWLDRTGQPARPIRLVAFASDPQEATP